MRSSVALALILLSLCYMVAAARIGPETGNAWLFGPEINSYKVMTTTFGTTVYQPADLTILAYVRNAIASFDLRCLSMPNQFDAYKMADTLQVSKRRLTVALILAIAIGLVVSIAIALMIWYAYGAGAKTDAWRTGMGRQPFDQLTDALKTPVKADVSGSMAIGAGFGITTLLMLLRMRLTWWALHPVGYAMANTSTMNQVRLPLLDCVACQTPRPALRWDAPLSAVAALLLRCHRRRLPRGRPDDAPRLLHRHQCLSRSTGENHPPLNRSFGPCEDRPTLL